MDAHPTPPTTRLDDLRAELARRKLAGFLVPLQDEHQGEWVPPSAQRLSWLTGFSGSAGLAIVLADRAAIFVDGRYTLQVRHQVDVRRFEPRHVSEQPPGDWIAEHLNGGALGYDPWLHTITDVERFRAACARAGGTFVACADNPLDAVWRDRPAPPTAPAAIHDVAFAGEEAASKAERLAAQLKREGQQAAVLTAPDSIAWLLNIRGGDLEYTPVVLAFAVLHADARVELFVDTAKLATVVRAHLGNRVAIADKGVLGEALDRLGAAKRRVLVDAATAPAWVSDRLTAAGADIVRGNDPCALPKACKNPVELEGIRAAHRRDGAALSTFLAWLDRRASSGEIDEISAADRLEAIRRAGDRFQRLSFPTIAGAGANGAIVHYRSTPATNRRPRPGELFLIDSGAQYLDGTTDVTRTIAVGEPTAEQRDRFTRVLKGHIALATVRFPQGTTGSQVDALARLALWDAGLDYDHGTGHGVGAYLGVHEGPHRISKLPNREALRPGMVVSNEPGYYKEGAFGIRIENLVAVREAEAPAGAERKMLEFETLTLAPIDRRAIDRRLLNTSEIAWLDAYHARVRIVLTPLVDRDTAGWLAEVTAPLAN
ncbi:MAG: aminopeptidase P family protein [Alphaproteobacteria bacterium]|nr:aminopeptidase P family protein [Alphaproteobacteria bacterium]